MITIKKASPDDATDIIAFQQAMAMETEGVELKGEVVANGVMAVFSDGNKGEYYVAEENGAVVASLMITYEWSDWRNASVWWFQSVYVIPSYRRLGVFRMMYDHVKKEGIERGIAGLRLYVDAGNTRAQKTYEAMGMNGAHYRTFEWMADQAVGNRQ
ncbi:MAG: GNAT family N-acetyltransferase [Bacteroidales bacterium]